MKQLNAIRRQLFPIVGILAAFELTSCGSAEFSPASNSSNPQSSDATPQEPFEEIPDTEINLAEWSFSCSESPDKFAAPIEGAQFVIKNQGPHQFYKDRISDKSKLGINTKLCSAQSIKRDIVLTIDVSSSMSSGWLFKTGNDPYLNGSCGRLQAVSSVISESFKSKQNRVAIVTFSSSVVVSSTKFHENEASLTQEVISKASASSLADVLCAGISGTSYDEGLKQSATLFSDKSRKDASKELYFVSDGEPESGREGRKNAADLRAGMVTIATVMLGSENDAIMKNDIASKDKSNVALHARATDASQLMNVVSSLAQNKFVGGWFGLKSLGSGGEFKKTTLSAKDFTSDVFKTQIPLEKSLYPEGIEYYFEYWDRFEQKYRNNGSIKW